MAVVTGPRRGWSGRWMTMNPPPPMPQDMGRTTERVKLVATAASTALPPRRSISAPAAEAAEWSAATAAWKKWGEPGGAAGAGWRETDWVGVAQAGRRAAASVRSNASGTDVARPMDHRVQLGPARRTGAALSN